MSFLMYGKVAHTERVGPPLYKAIRCSFPLWGEKQLILLESEVATLGDQTKHTLYTSHLPVWGLK